MKTKKKPKVSGTQELKRGAKKPNKAKVPGQKASKRALKKSKPTYEHHPDHSNTSEAYLTQNLEDDLKDAWQKIRAFGESLGEQRIYASGRAIMFSRKICYFFVRPQKAYLEVVIFLRSQWPQSSFRSIKAVSKTKYGHTFRLVHSDQVEGDLTEAISQAYLECPAY